MSDQKRGFPDTLSPEVAADMERLWSCTAIPQNEIADRLNLKHGTAFEAKNIEWHARRRCWNRDMLSKSFNGRTQIEERLATKSLERSNRIPRADNPVRRVAPGTHPANGFRLGMGQ